MLIQDFSPSIAVSEFVQCYRIVHFKFDHTEHVPVKAYPPKPEQCLHFFLKDPLVLDINGNKFNQPPIFLAGQRTSLVNHYNGRHLLNIQVVFQPTAVFRLTGIPASLLINQNIDATLLFPKSIRTVLEILQSAQSYTELLQIAEGFVQELILHIGKDVHSLDFLSRQMIQKGGNVSLDWLVGESCLSSKQFTRKFYERTGVNPKTFARIIRFNKAFNLKNCFPGKSWSYIADKCGYVDYQHLGKDYKDFTGFTPPALHMLENNSPENVLGLTRSLYHARVATGN